MIQSGDAPASFLQTVSAAGMENVEWGHSMRKVRPTRAQSTIDASHISSCASRARKRAPRSPLQPSRRRS